MKTIDVEGRPLRATLALSAIGLGVALLAGCASDRGLAPQAQRMLDASDLSSQQVLAAHRGVQQAWPKEDWWRSWGDPQLNDLIERGLRDNPSLAQALARTRAGDAEVALAQSNLGPTLGAMAGYSGVRLPDAVIPKTMGGGSLGYHSDVIAQFKWDADIWGGKRAAWEAAVSERDAKLIEAQAARITISTAIARYYAQLAAAHLQSNVAREDVRRAQQLNTLQAQRVKQGLDNQIASQQTQAELSQAQQRQRQADQAIAHLQLAVMQAAGQSPDLAPKMKPPVITPAGQQFALGAPDDAPVALLAHRADIQAAKLRVLASQKRIDNAKTQFLPNVSIGAMAGGLGNGQFDLFHMANLFYQFGPSVTLPIFESGKLRANLAGQNAQYEAAVAQYNQTLTDALHQVADRVVTARALRQQLAQQQVTLNATQKALELMRQRQQKGLANQLQVLQLQQQHLQAQQQLVQLQGQLMDNAIGLNLALGGGYSAATVTTTATANASATTTASKP